MRGPEILPGILPGVLPGAASGTLPHLPGATAGPSRRERFDALVLEAAALVEERWHDRLGLVDYAVEDTPLVPDDWDEHTVPLAALVRGHGGAPTRLVIFRRPVEHRCSNRQELRALVLTVVVEQVAELLGLPTDEVDPRG